MSRVLLSNSQLAEWRLLLTHYASIGPAQYMEVMTALQDFPAIDESRAGVPIARRTARHLLHIFDDLAATAEREDLRAGAGQAAQAIRTWEQFGTE